MNYTKEQIDVAMEMSGFDENTKADFLINLNGSAKIIYARNFKKCVPEKDWGKVCFHTFGCQLRGHNERCRVTKSCFEKVK